MCGLLKISPHTKSKLSAEKTVKREEVNEMTYAKPELILLKKALAAIQGNPPGSKLGGPSDQSIQVTAAAYEADE